MFICLMQLFALFLGKLIFYCFGDCKLRSSCDYKNSNISLAKTKIKQQKPLNCKYSISVLLLLQQKPLCELVKTMQFMLYRNAKEMLHILHIV